MLAVLKAPPAIEVTVFDKLAGGRSMGAFK